MYLPSITIQFPPDELCDHVCSKYTEDLENWMSSSSGWMERMEPWKTKKVPWGRQRHVPHVAVPRWFGSYPGTGGLGVADS